VYNAGLEGSILHTYAAYMTDQLISQKEVAEFEPKEYSCERQEDKILWACCRGLSVEIIRVLDYLIEKDILTYDIKEMLIVEDGICELKVYGEDVEDILKKYPNVKVAMFAENKRNNKVMMYYSRSGADNITDMYEIGTCDLSDEKKWTLRHSPTESCFVEGDVQYTFKYEDDWNECNYVYDCNNMKYQLGK
jgi:hypothetical protein